MKIGGKAPHAFSKKGRVEVRCGLHPGMRLIVNVT
jgi:plastocyanin